MVAGANKGREEGELEDRDYKDNGKEGRQGSSTRKGRRTCGPRKHKRTSSDEGWGQMTRTTSSDRASWPNVTLVDNFPLFF